MEAPSLKPWLIFYLDAYLELDTDRTHNMGISKIPWSSIKRYSDHFNLDEEQSERLFYFIRAMDDANVRRLEGKLKK